MYFCCEKNGRLVGVARSYWWKFGKADKTTENDNKRQGKHATGIKTYGEWGTHPVDRPVSDIDTHGEIYRQVGVQRRRAIAGG